MMHMAFIFIAAVIGAIVTIVTGIVSIVTGVIAGVSIVSGIIAGVGRVVTRIGGIVTRIGEEKLVGIWVGSGHILIARRNGQQGGGEENDWCFHLSGVLLSKNRL
jgi:hypothetical protein